MSLHDILKSTHVGKTKRVIATQATGVYGRSYDVVVPKDTEVRLIASENRWIVGDLGWLEHNVGRDSPIFHVACHYGIPIDEADVTEVRLKG